MGRKKGPPAFRGKKIIRSIYVTREMDLDLRHRSRAANYSVSDLLAYAWFVAGAGATRETIDRFKDARQEPATT